MPGPKLVTLVSYGTMENPNIVTVSYAGQITDRLMYVSLRPSRNSNQSIRGCKRFAINYIGSDLVKEADFCGIYSSRDTDKFKETGLNLDFDQEIPMIVESPLSLECVLKNITRMGEHDVFFGEVNKAIRRNEESSWLYHDNFEYFGNGNQLGSLFQIGK
ncbi:MAG: flavin reductase family protein [Candidatus Nanoarchaeia archaeon]|nr:flavin reductase family protein [Candidatus Nanoarchaeia archaeon]